MHTSKRILPMPAANAAHALWDLRDSSALACVDQDETTAYACLAAQAAGFARSLDARGVRPGDRVAILLPRSVPAIAAHYGALAAGAIAVPINDTLRPRQVGRILDDAAPRLLITDPIALARTGYLPRRDLPVLHPEEISTNADWYPVARRYLDRAQILYTSGSTGLPKGVVHSHGNVTANSRIVSSYLGLSSDDRTISLLPFSSVFGLNQLLCAIETGGSLVIERSPLSHTVACSIKRNRVSVLAAVPPLWIQLLRVPEMQSTIPSLRVLQTAGGHLPAAVVRSIRHAQPQAALFVMYGMTEVMRSTYLPPDQVDARPESIGRAMPESEVRVVKEDGREAAVGEVGELVHMGPTVALGYWRNASATAQTFRTDDALPSRAVFTGDLVRRDAEGFLYFVGRKDRMIRSLGHRIGPDEIIDVILASGQVVEAAITTEPDDLLGDKIIAHVVLEQNGSLRELERYCRLEMPRWMRPSQIQLHDELARAASGKYDLQELSVR